MSFAFSSLSARSSPRLSLRIRDEGLSVAELEEQIGLLKREKTNLINEKSLVKARLARMRSVSKDNRKVVPDTEIMEKEIIKLEQRLVAKRADLSTIIGSDLAANVEELQEESLMLHMEKARLDQNKQKLEKILKSVSKGRKEVSSGLNEKILRQKNVLRRLNKEVEEIKTRNAKISAKLADHDTQIQKSKKEEQKNEYKRKIEELEKRIKVENEEIYRIRGEIEGVTNSQDKDLVVLQSFL